MSYTRQDISTEKPPAASALMFTAAGLVRFNGELQ